MPGEGAPLPQLRRQPRGLRASGRGLVVVSVALLCTLATVRLDRRMPILDLPAAWAQPRRMTDRARIRLSQRLLSRGLGRMSQGRYREAVSYLARSYRLNPRVQVLFLVGQCYELSGDLARAQEVYEKVVVAPGKDVDRSDVLRRLASIRRQRGEPTKAGPTPKLKPEPASMPASRPGLSSDERDEVFGESDEKGSDKLAAEKDGKEGADIEKKLLDIGNDRLQIGGLLYFRFTWNILRSTRLTDHRISMPNLCDVFLDARPMERLRGYVVGRLNWDPTVNESDALATAMGKSRASAQLIEGWLKLDVLHRVFVTLGQQRVRWGATSLWNPVDLINTTPRAILVPYDDRPGVPMVKLHAPIEKLGANLYAIGFLDTASNLENAGVAGRAEFAFRTVEMGLSGGYHHGKDSKASFDISAGLWNFDLTSEVAVKFADRFEHGVSLQIASGLSYTVRVFQDDRLILAGEHFYNQEGTDRVNPMDLVKGTVEPFYAGRHYGALTVLLPSPGSWNDWTFRASGVGNFSDNTFAVQLDVAVLLFQFLTLEMLVTGHMGCWGELRVGDRAFPPADRATARLLFSPDDATRPVPGQVIDLALLLSMKI
jgi:tetratricopeptide (TPR) repeat protein